MFGEIPATDREVPENPQKTLRSPYGDLFQNRLITNPVDPAFALPIAANLLLADHRPALVAALAVSDVDLTLAAGEDRRRAHPRQPLDTGWVQRPRQWAAACARQTW